MERNKIKGVYQYLLAAGSVLLAGGVCYLLSDFIGYRVVALILLFTVSVFAMFFEIFPVLLAALLSALIWDLFFIPPKFTLFISHAEDVLMLCMYFIVAMLNAVLNYKKRQWEKIARKREERNAAFKLYNTLLNSLSHELRTPISAIIGAADNLKTDKNILSVKDKEDLVSEISKASLKLNRQVENLLNMSRIESGVIKPVKDWCDISELMYTVRNQVKEFSGEHKIVVQIKENLPLFNIDGGLTEQCIFNLVSNAIHYTPKGSVITLSAFLEGTSLKIIVEDNGYGFPEGEIENVFEKFYRLKNSGTGGVGLGLSIVKGFTEAQNGSISLKNKKSGGAEFTIIIPDAIRKKIA